MKEKSSRLIAGIVSYAALAAVALSIVIFENEESKKDLMSALHSETKNILDAFTKSIMLTYTTNIEIESLLTQKLSAAAQIAGYFAGKPNISENLKHIENDFGLNSLMLVDSIGNIYCCAGRTGKVNQIDTELAAELTNPDNIEEDHINIGLLHNPISKKEAYYVAAKIGQGLYALAGIDAAKLLDYRKKLGIGRQVRSFAENPEIEYVLLQDMDGIYSASQGVGEIGAIESDKFLNNAWQTGTLNSRMRNYKGKSVYEGVEAITMSDGSKLLARIALSVEKTNAISHRAETRTVFIGIGIFICGGLILGFIIYRERLVLLRERHITTRTYLSHLLGNITDAVIVVDMNFSFTVFNEPAEKAFKMKAVDVIGSNYNELFPNDELKLRRAIQESRAILIEEIIYGADRKNFELSASIIKGKNDDTDSAIAIVRDITEIRRSQELSRRDERIKALGELAAAVAHEIRNPLNSVSVVAQRFETEFEPIEGRDEFRKLASTVRKEIKRINNIIKQFLDYARPPRLELKECRLDSLVSDSIFLIRSEAEKNNIKIVENLQEGVTLRLDKEKMKQALLNLLRNAIEAMPGGGELICSVNKDNGRVLINICDTGSGIKEEIKQKIFNLYFTTKKSGTGLGLAVVHQIISEHGGEIIIENRLGGGVEVKIYLDS